MSEPPTPPPQPPDEEPPPWPPPAASAPVWPPRTDPWSQPGPSWAQAPSQPWAQGPHPPGAWGGPAWPHHPGDEVPTATAWPPGPTQPPGVPAHRADPWHGRPLQGEERAWVPAAHWLALLTTWLGPLVVLLTVGERNPRVREHAKESLNFEITLALALLAAGLLTFVVVGFLLLGLLLVAWLVLRIGATITVAKGEPYRYPLSIRFVR